MTKAPITTLTLHFDAPARRKFGRWAVIVPRSEHVVEALEVMQCDATNDPVETFAEAKELATAALAALGFNAQWEDGIDGWDRRTPYAKTTLEVRA